MPVTPLIPHLGSSLPLCRQRISTPLHWIVDWQRKRIEIYTLDYDEEGEPQYYLFKNITEENKEELGIVHFPHIKIEFDELFNF